MLGGQTLHASFSVQAPVNEEGYLSSISICRECCEAAVMAWARKARGDAQDPPDAPTPRPPGTPAESAGCELLERAA
jgi:hypothetical protein